MDKQMTYRGPSDSVTLTPGPIRVGLWKEFIQLTKPGIIRSNLMAAFAGFWVAAKWDIPWLTLLWMLVGTTLVLASSCVFNNYFDRDFDMKMERTKKRALPEGRLKPNTVLGYAIILGAAGLAVLFGLVNVLSGVVGIAGMFFYVVIYTLWLKRTSTWSTSVGGISGAMPPVIGYVAVTGQIDMGAVLLFALLFLWQPPHFWALGIRRVEEYRAAGYPLLPVVKGITRTKWQMIPYVVLLLPVSWLFYSYGYTGIIYGILGTIINAIWLFICIAGFRAKDTEAWAKKNFIWSINVLMLNMLVMILDTMGKV
ncbi:heme o synthase [Paenibacillus thiaminolyticus]|uniref:Protoheme IX farnesyltransferase n=1 Tax=Paenibacillus thiaminolyticus TaxID=49283 RepID=A0AAJ1LDL7_PANTH|nr:heme o synthase [Paenibacillus thiaminolyticus]MCY9536223.1 heme o synthase [Paenibacillus thiaminolyticus]MCY9603512.1 heme o synthase [Paenibacillus thiaminolyticus]MCY9605646.1 heme o synthase [Paenibacillus thiaminolyticus]MCY9611853.1 heme o synthase [Paenibacillus thiaminolyticus]MCY9620948.1 heme o synthase [Paenibacillus thiaminolyticus]